MTPKGKLGARCLTEGGCAEGLECVRSARLSPDGGREGVCAGACESFLDCPAGCTCAEGSSQIGARSGCLWRASSPRESVCPAIDRTIGNGGFLSYCQQPTDCVPPYVCNPFHQLEDGGVDGTCVRACSRQSDCAPSFYSCACEGGLCQNPPIVENTQANQGWCEQPATSCVPETDAEFCARLRANCDLVNADDNCGTARSVDCGACTRSFTCGGAGTPNVCGSMDCTSESDAAFCSRRGKTCGVVSDIDECGRTRNVECGTCVPAECEATSTCTNGSCVATNKPEGARCSPMDSVIDRNFCTGFATSGQPICVTVSAYCDRDGADFVFQSADGGTQRGNGPCTCTQPWELTFEFNVSGQSIDPIVKTCAQCSQLGTRAVCFGN